MSDHDHRDPFDQGLKHDLRVLEARSNRRKVLGWLAAAGLTPFLGCSSDGSDLGEAAGSSGAAGSAGTGSTDTCAKIPEETGGPYPGDGTNGPNALTSSGIVRDDITASFGSFTGTAEGVPLTVKLKIVDASSCASRAGYAVYIWHCDRDGNYSMYTAAAANYLRGVQETDADGVVEFTTIFPGCYSGRWPHIHFEVFSSLEEATAATGKVATSQLALPQAPCSEVYATTGYSSSVRNLAGITLASDNVFSDGADSETPTVTGSVSEGYVAELTVGV